jgi:hypothetical protein
MRVASRIGTGLARSAGLGMVGASVEGGMTENEIAREADVTPVCW